MSISRCWDLEHMFISSKTMNSSIQLLALLDCHWQGCWFIKLWKRENASMIPPLFYASLRYIVLPPRVPHTKIQVKEVSLLSKPSTFKVISCTSQVPCNMAPCPTSTWSISDWARETAYSAWRMGIKGSSNIVNDHPSMMVDRILMDLWSRVSWAPCRAGVDGNSASQTFDLWTWHT